MHAIKSLHIVDVGPCFVAFQISGILGRRWCTASSRPECFAGTRLCQAPGSDLGGMISLVQHHLHPFPLKNTFVKVTAKDVLPKRG